MSLLQWVKNIHNGIMEMFSEDRKVKPGDAIGVSRILYDHYGIYTGEDLIIHYHQRMTDGKLIVQETHIEEFLSGASTYFILDCEYRKPHKSAREALEALNKIKIFSPEETVIRARNKLGTGKYHLLLNNCEHFALWCKTGISQSHQIDELLWFIPHINCNYYQAR